jgi:hypothetical protein
MRSALPAAEEIVARNERIVLTARDGLRVLELLDHHLRRYARRNHESGGARTFVAVAPDMLAIILGYYTISPGAIAFAKTPAMLTRNLGSYEVPVFRLGRLAVSRGRPRD